MGTNASKCASESSNQSSTEFDERRSGEDPSDALTCNPAVKVVAAEKERPSPDFHTMQQTTADQHPPSGGPKRISTNLNNTMASSDGVILENRVNDYDNEVKMNKEEHPKTKHMLTRSNAFTRENQSLIQTNLDQQETETQTKTKNTEIEQIKFGFGTARHSGSFGYKRNSNHDADVKRDAQKQRLREECESLRLRCERLDSEAQELKAKLEAKTSECEELTLRLSRIVSDRLTDENPNIADLSDPNRPQKLGEQFAELYCNEWVDALEELTSKKMTEKEAVQLLLELLKTIYMTCCAKSKKQLTDLNQQISLFTGIAFSGQAQKNRPKLSTKSYKEERKKHYNLFLESINNDLRAPLLGLLPKKSKAAKSLDRYIRESTEVCWVMCIQDPPVDLVFTGWRGEHFDESRYTHYSKSGNQIDYIVWPVVLLHNNGQVIRKGVAEGKGDKGTARGRMT